MNPSPLRIGIAGAGAIGCTLAARLAGHGHTVKVLARGETLFFKPKVWQKVANL